MQQFSKLPQTSNLTKQQRSPSEEVLPEDAWAAHQHVRKVLVPNECNRLAGFPGRVLLVALATRLVRNQARKAVVSLRLQRSAWSGFLPDCNLLGCVRQAIIFWAGVIVDNPFEQIEIRKEAL